jgi:phage terminase large subunit-like protein
MESEYTKAVNEGGRSEVEFKTKNLNIPCGVAEVWIQDEVWQKCPNNYNLEALKGRTCFAGIDFAATSDFTACVLLFPSENEGEPHILLPFFYIPEETAKMRSREFPDVLRWINSGLLTITPGNVTDYDYLIADLHRLRGEYDIQAIGYDQYNAFQTVARLEADGFPMDKFAQGIMNMSAPTKEFERLVKQGMINHGGNPIMRWMLSNVQPYYDQNENLKIRKKKNSLNLKIDGIIASVIALGEYIKNPVETYSGGIYFV